MNCLECSTNQYKLRAEWLSDELAEVRRELATAREQNRQLVDTIRWLENANPKPAS